MKKIELLSPAGDLERLKVAFAYGADAVYMGGKSLGMRAKAKNFDMSEIQEAVDYAHSIGKKVFITANIYAHNQDLDGAEDYFKTLYQMGVDALIVADMGLFALAKAAVPDMEIHISTQANNTNYASVGMWKQLGAHRVVLARELSMTEIKEISTRQPEVELEAFVHGATCMAYSGRCLISNFVNGRSANKGECAQPCRWDYTIVEKNSGVEMRLEEDERGTRIMNTKDMCMIEHIPDLLDSGIFSFKIEGRMKTAYYVGAVTKTYREAIDDYLTDPALYEKKKPYYVNEINKVTNRAYTTAFYYGKAGAETHNYEGKEIRGDYEFVAIVEDYDAQTGYASIEQRYKFEVGDTIELLRHHGENVTQVVEVLLNEKGEAVDSAPHPKQKLRIKLDTPVQKYDMLRTVKKGVE